MEQNFNPTTLSKLKKGIFFRFVKPNGTMGSTVYVHTGKDRKHGYSRYKFDDVNDYSYTKTDRKVAIDFTF